MISPRRGGGGPGPNTGTGQLYVSHQSNNLILRFNGATAATGNVSPTATISGGATLLSSPQYIFVDTSNDRLYVANANGADILVFDHASTANGNIAPTRNISSTSLVTPTDVALDPVKDLLYVADISGVVSFAAASTADGATVAVRTIQLSFTPHAILLDANNDRLFVTDPTNNAIDIFDAASTLNGAVAASRSISGTNTQLAQPLGLRIDGAGRLMVSNFSPPSIVIYGNAATANGNITPMSVISGSNTTLTGPTQMAIDPTTNSGELYVADPFGAHVAVFSNISTLTGTVNAQPNRNITGSNTQLIGTAAPTARGVALDATR